MERLLTTSGLHPALIFGQLRGEVIDYVISSYELDMRIIRMWYYRPGVQIHCGRAYNYIPSDIGSIIHEHPQMRNGGKYHSKFILITTREMLRLIIMTTNMTKMVQNVENDYYIADIPKSESVNRTWNTDLLNRYFSLVGVILKVDITQYAWQGIHGQLMCSLPMFITHSECWRQIQPMRETEGVATVKASTGVLSYDIRPVFGIQRCRFQYSKKNQNLGIIDKIDSGYYEIEELKDAMTYHQKLYIIYYTAPVYEKWYIITSANLTKSAWSNINYEMGVAWNCTSRPQSNKELFKRI